MSAYNFFSLFHSFGRYTAVLIETSRWISSRSRSRILQSLTILRLKGLLRLYLLLLGPKSSIRPFRVPVSTRLSMSSFACFFFLFSRMWKEVSLRTVHWLWVNLTASYLFTTIHELKSCLFHAYSLGILPHATKAERVPISSSSSSIGPPGSNNEWSKTLEYALSALTRQECGIHFVGCVAPLFLLDNQPKGPPRAMAYGLPFWVWRMGQGLAFA